MPHIFVDVPVHPSGLEAVAAVPGVSIDRAEQPGQRSRPLPAERLCDVEILFCTHAPANVEVMRKLRWIQLASVGYSQLLGLDLPGRGIVVTNARGCFDAPIAEWNLAMMVNLARDVRGMIRNQDAAVWDNSAGFQREIRGMTVGIWGYGGIGRETARLARAFGLRVHVLTRQGVGARTGVYAVPGTGDPDGTLPDRVWRTGDEQAFLHGLDFLVVAMPLTPTTEGIVGERELAALPRTAYLLNPARGPIVREAALLRALDEGWISGAALDTHYAYPLPPEHRLWRYPNVILTPHVAGSSLSQHYLERIWQIFGLNLARYSQHTDLLNHVAADQLTGSLGAG